jgi:hypothetical protein
MELEHAREGLRLYYKGGSLYWISHVLYPFILFENSKGAPALYNVANREGDNATDPALDRTPVV